MSSPTLPIPPPHILIVIPGYMGSRLRSRRTGELVWIDIPRLISDPLRIPETLERLFDQLKYPNDDLVPDGIMDEVIFLPPLFKQEQYSRLLEILTSWNYETPSPKLSSGKFPLYAFTYDWRQDNRISARQLAQAVKIWKSRHPGSNVWIIAHSNGGIVARWYIEKEGGAEHVERLFLLASPWDGAPKALQVFQDGVDYFLLRFFNQFSVQDLIHEAMLTFPSFFQLLPYRLPFLRDVRGQTVDPFSDPRWLETPHQRMLLLEGQAFNHELGTNLAVETLCFFGIKQPTTSSGVVEFSTSGGFKRITWEKTEDGDGTVPIHSALHWQAAQKLPYAANHGDLYVAPAFLDKLKYELVNRYRYGALSAVSTSQIKAQFEADQDAYEPGQPIQLQVTLSQLESGLPVLGALVEARLIWRQALPIEGSYRPLSLPACLLKEVPHAPGEYTGSLQAPLSPGYYKIMVSAHPRRQPRIEIEELILVEGSESIIK